jgi:hypothetical protein
LAPWRYEIGIYEDLIVYFQAMNRPDVAELLRRNARSERAALAKIRTLQSKLAPVRGTGRAMAMRGESIYESSQCLQPDG